MQARADQARIRADRPSGAARACTAASRRADPAPAVTPCITRGCEQAKYPPDLQPNVPAPRYRLATASLEVNLSKHVLYYVRNGAIQRIIDASTGSSTWYYSQGRWARAITPAGRFRIYWRYSGGWQAGPLGSMYRPNYIYGGYAVHGMTSVPALSGQPRLRPDDRPGDGPHVVLAVAGHAGCDLCLVITAELFRMPERLGRPGPPRCVLKQRSASGLLVMNRSGP